MAYKESKFNRLDAPVPGESLTSEPGNYPWENPPQYPKVSDGFLWVFNQMHKEPQLTQLISLLDTGVPVEALTKTLLFTGFLEGKFTVDVARLLEPIVAMQIMSKAQVAEIPAKINLEDTEDTEFYKDMAKVKKSIDLDNLPMDKMTEEKIEKESVKGLMEK